MNLALVSVHIKNSPRAIPLGPAMIASSLHKELGSCVTSEIINLYMNQSIENFLKIITSKPRDIVGFSMFVWNRNRILETIEKLKADHPEIIICLGGPEATASYDNLIDNPNIDFIVKGEGEKVFSNAVATIMESKSAENISTSPIVPNLEELPSPFLDGTIRPENYSGLLWELSRGCPFKCDFCFESRGTAGIRRFSFDRIKQELELFQEHGVEQIFVLDPTFNYNPKNAKKILQLIVEKQADIQFYFEVRSEFLDEELAELFSMISCSLQIGLQSSDPNVLKNINRKINQDDFQEKILLLHQNQVVYGFDLIYGLPTDTLERFKNSIDFALGMAPNHLDIFPLSVLPGTKLFDTASSFNMNYLHENPYTVISTPTFSETEMLEAKEIANACEQFYNNGKAVPWFSLVIETLAMKPSDFLIEFANWLSLDENISEDPFRQQLAFLKHIFEDKMQNSELGNIASDIAAYFGYTAMLMECSTGISTAINANCKYILNPDSCFVDFKYDPISLEEQIYSGITDIHDLPFVLEKMEYEVFFYINNSELDVKFFTTPQKDLLNSYKNGGNELPDIPEESEFLASCIDEQILLEK